MNPEDLEELRTRDVAAGHVALRGRAALEARADEDPGEPLGGPVAQTARTLRRFANQAVAATIWSSAPPGGSPTS